MQISRQVWGVLITLFGALLFSIKAVLGKLIYIETDIEVSTLLLLRMLFALPFYLVSFSWAIKRFKAKVKSPDGSPSGLSFLQKLSIACFLGMIGYYISSYLDFYGLKFISAGLERVILFSYPAWVVMLGALLYKTPVQKKQVFALLLSYLGIIIAFLGDFKGLPVSAEVWKGSILVVCCAFTFALYVLWSGRFIPILGVGLFTSTAMLGATLAIALHFFLSGQTFEVLTSFSSKVYFYFFLMGVFTTVVPSYLVSAGISRIGSSNVAIVSSIGPIFTIFLAWYYLGESFGFIQMLGSLLVIGGVWMISQKKTAPLPPQDFSKK